MEPSSGRKFVLEPQGGLKVKETPPAHSIELCILGSQSGIPTLQRNMSGALLRVNSSQAVLIDCGGGTQQQLLRAGVWIGHIQCICITHLHGDHCADLVGLLALRSMRKLQTPLTVLGPVGVQEWIDVQSRLSQLYLSYPLTVKELTGPLEEELELPGLGGWKIQAVPLTHRVPCFGYVFSEPPQPAPFSAARALQRGATKAHLAVLAKGQTVILEDGSTLSPLDCLDEPGATQQPPRRRISVLGDYNAAPFGLPTDLDVIVTECTFPSSEVAKAERAGHQTPVTLAPLLRTARPRLALLTHFSASLTDYPKPGQPTPETLQQELQTSLETDTDSNTTVLAVQDFDRFFVPPHKIVK